MLSGFRSSSELAAVFTGLSDDAVISEFRRQEGGGERADIPVKVAEFAILNNGDALIGEDSARSKFHAETISDWGSDSIGDQLCNDLDKVVLVHRLREVVSLLGFTRFESSNPDRDGELDLEVIRASLADSITWLPAVENRGEGLFLSFKPENIQAWMATPGVRSRGEKLDAGWKTWANEHNLDSVRWFPGLPYVMLHSLSHMLMTAIALDCGYPASSLRERVYAGDQRYGILIYTGSADSEGTLGGLVQAGRRLTQHLLRSYKENLLCSNDPICAEHDPSSTLEERPLHGAACHGCLLTSETSCEQRNDFLDRALVVPTVGTPDAAFFQLPNIVL